MVPVDLCWLYLPPSTDIRNPHFVPFVSVNRISRWPRYLCVWSLEVFRNWTMAGMCLCCLNSFCKVVSVWGLAEVSIEGKYSFTCWNHVHTGILEWPRRQWEIMSACSLAHLRCLLLDFFLCVFRSRQDPYLTTFWSRMTLIMPRVLQKKLGVKTKRWVLWHAFHEWSIHKLFCWRTGDVIV